LLTDCTDPEHGVTKLCNDHGTCQDDKVTCVCNTGYDITLGPLCNVCAAGYTLSTDGLNRCINQAACMTVGKAVVELECYGHGFCTEDTTEGTKTPWFC
jgi:hypothetical protein